MVTDVASAWFGSLRATLAALPALSVPTIITVSGTPSDGSPVMRSLSISQVAGGAVALIVLTLLGAWIFGGFSGLGTGGTIALILGITLSVALGVGLMAATFYSSRGQDEVVYQAGRDEREHDGSAP
jgi:hypothetical protein